ncbi:MAG: hypothetical protein HRT89_17070 [Lentisphaeria bacterium]|nr:hypothetical protein [Lentisphaeria bacterium]NQZ69772.1 hypothetical protein [Lentisphaeria bacterium]
MRNGLIVAVIVGVAAFRIFGNSGSSIDDQLVTVCNEMNKKTPYMVDQVTRLDSTVPLSGEIKYLYTLIGIKELSADQKKTIETNTRNLVKNSSDLKIFRDEGIDMTYLYRNESGKEIFEFSIKH